ncbi:MAG: hypothetical protein K6L76_05690 [Agarilytica sp.]
MNIERELAVPQKHPCYEDHFPGSPIVPGAVLVAWLFSMIKDEFRDVRPKQVKSIKFVSAALPGDQCKVKLELDTQREKIKVQLTRDETLVLKGEMLVSMAKTGEPGL